MDIRETCCSKDKYELTFPSFSAVFIHTFALEADTLLGHLRKTDLCDYDTQIKEMKALLKEEPKGNDRPISSLAEFTGKHIVKMSPEVERLLFSASCMSNEQIARYSLKGFDFRIPVRSDSEINDKGEEVKDFESVDFEGHVNVELSQFFGNIFSVTYRFLFDGFTCKILQADETDNEYLGAPGRPRVDATTNHLIALLSSCLGAEYWTGSDKVNEGGIDLENRLILNKFWLSESGEEIIYKEEKPEEAGDLSEEQAAEIEEKKKKNILSLKDADRVFDEVLLRYKRFIVREFTGNPFKEDTLEEVIVADDSRYAMVDIWETVKHPFGKSLNKDMFSDDMWPKLNEAEIINHIRDYHKPELVGLMSMYPAEWPYRTAEAYDEVCGENIAIDTDDLVLAGSHMTVVIGTYGRRGDGVNGVNWKEVMKDRRFYHVSWEEYLLIVQFVLAKKHTFNNAIDTLLHLTEDMTRISKRKIGDCAKSALAASKRTIELDVIRHMKFPSHKVMYDRTAKRLELESDFQRFKDVQEVVSANLQSLGEYHAAKADSWMNTGLVAISVVSLFELAFQNSGWPFVGHFFGEGHDWSGLASVISMLAAILAFIGLFWVAVRIIKQSKES